MRAAKRPASAILARRSVEVSDKEGVEDINGLIKSEKQSYA
jgi:hypothetical protein